jgi:hypothetical protein
MLQAMLKSIRFQGLPDVRPLPVPLRVAVLAPRGDSGEQSRRVRDHFSMDVST